MSKFKNLFYSLRQEIRCFLAKYPVIYFSQKKLLHGFVDEDRMIAHNTDIVIEGFPGSANSFAVFSFKIAQKREVKMAHHMHDPSQIIVAVKAKIPTLVLIRTPREAVLSYIVRFNNNLTSQEEEEEEVIKLIIIQLKRYINFYKKIIEYKNSLIISDYKNVICSYEEIIENINNYYGTSFRHFICNKQNTNQVFEYMNLLCRKKFGFVNDNIVARPSESKNKNKKELYKYFEVDKVNRLLVSAENVYSEILS